MNSIINRIILLVASLALAWCAVLGASGINRWAVARADGTTILLVILACVSLFLAVTTFMTFLDKLIDEHRADSVDAVCVVGLGAICFSFVFGAIVAPVGSDAGFGAWMTPWDFLLVLGAIPMVFVIKEIAVDISVANKKETPQA